MPLTFIAARLPLGDTVHALLTFLRRRLERNRAAYRRDRRLADFAG
jgi:hypothetical protein